MYLHEDLVYVATLQNSNNNIILNDKHFRLVPDGLAVRIPGSHPGGPGSTPGLGICFYPQTYFYLICQCIKAF